MNTEKTEKEIRQLFSELRAEDSQRVPLFNAVTRAAPSFTSTGLSFSWFRFALGTTATVLVIATIARTAIRLHKGSIERERQQWAALSSWEAPTDALLIISSVAWESTITTPSDFLINNRPVSPDTNPEHL
jgi:hypothetical protein